MQTTIGEIIRTTSSSFNYTITIDNKPENLPEGCNSQLEGIVGIAKDVLNLFEHPQKTKRTGVKNFFMTLRGRVRYLLKEEDILELMSGVERVKSTLQLALQAVALPCIAKVQDHVGQRSDQMETLIRQLDTNLQEEIRKRAKETNEFLKESLRKERVVFVQLASKKESEPSTFKEVVGEDSQENESDDGLYRSDYSLATSNGAVGDKWIPPSTDMTLSLDAVETPPQSKDVESSLALVPADNNAMKAIQKSTMEEAEIDEELDLFVCEGALVVASTNTKNPSPSNSDELLTLEDRNLSSAVPLWEYHVKLMKVIGSTLTSQMRKTLLKL